MTPHRLAGAALAGLALTGLLAACGGASTDAGYVPVQPGAAAAQVGNSNPVQAPMQSVPGTNANGAVAGAAPQKPTDFLTLARQFVFLRNTGTRALATIKAQTSNTDLGADKQAMAEAANIYAAYARNLLALPFPGSMQNDASALATVVRTEQATFVQASQVTAFNQLDPLLQQLVNSQDDQLNATNALEKDLGLPQSTPPPA
ncbi:MAG TPA: hypothetical protein VH134_16130 [Candidatus Dormibacteraeota bacterium]|nr:hypothetical protein [Candidatus Dormibacteraeota bacterium]